MNRARDAYDIDGDFYSEPRSHPSEDSGAVLVYVFAAFLFVAALLVVVVARR